MLSNFCPENGKRKEIAAVRTSSETVWIVVVRSYCLPIYCVLCAVHTNQSSSQCASDVAENGTENTILMSAAYECVCVVRFGHYWIDSSISLWLLYPFKVFCTRTEPSTRVVRHIQPADHSSELAYLSTSSSAFEHFEHFRFMCGSAVAAKIVFLTNLRSLKALLSFISFPFGSSVVVFYRDASEARNTIISYLQVRHRVHQSEWKLCVYHSADQDDNINCVLTISNSGKSISIFLHPLSARERESGVCVCVCACVQEMNKQKRIIVKEI